MLIRPVLASPVGVARSPWHSIDGALILFHSVKGSPLQGQGVGKTGVRQSKCIIQTIINRGIQCREH